MKALFKTLLSSIAAGITIGMGGSVYLACENKYVGAILFSVALLSICYMGTYLYTGKIGFLAEKFSLSTVSHLAVGLLGNDIGATLVGKVVRFSSPKLAGVAQELSAKKLEIDFLKVVGLGALCGILMYLAVKTFVAKGTPLGVMYCIPVFILCGFEHSIADIFYMACGGRSIFELPVFLFTVAVILGNTIGAMALSYIYRFATAEKKAD